MVMTAVVLAGGEMAPEDPLYGEGRDGFRSLIRIGGKPMVQWVVDAVDESAVIRKIYLVGLPDHYGIKAQNPLHFLPDADGLFENIRAGVLQSAADHPDIRKVFLASADAPALRPEMVNWLAEKVQAHPEALIYYNVISREQMDIRFPEANRSFVPFRDVAVCGGDLNVVDTALFLKERPVWKKLTEARKTPMKQALILGVDTLLLVLLRLVTLEEAVRRVSRRLDLEACAFLTPFAEMGMDADKPHQLEILRRDMEGQA